MKEVPVCIIGCGPIGLAGALLLSHLGIKTLMIERRSEVNTHPRSRFVDTNTMELMRFLGIEKVVEDSGLGPDWTYCNRWCDSLTNYQIGTVVTPSFFTVPKTTSPTMPVMTCQDYVENALLSKVHNNEFIDVLYRTEAIGLDQDDEGTTVQIRDLETGEESTIAASYTIGSDGPHSFVREQIGSVLETAPLATFAQDVIFEADLSAYVEGRKGALLYNATKSGMLVFQPLNGITRWRCQITIPTEELLPNETVVERILEAVGTEDEVPITIKSTGVWRPTPGCVDRMRLGRVFLAGDAAHISVPTGGMGNNIGFAGIRNLAWKLAYVIKGLSSPEILDSYEIEHRPIALERIQTGVDTTQAMVKIFGYFYAGMDTSEAIYETRYYADYDGVVLGYELSSDLIADKHKPALKLENPIKDYIPTVLAGRKAPHIWVSEKEGQSIIDWFGLDYVLIAGNAVEAENWQEAVSEIQSRSDYPIRLETLATVASAPYSKDELVLVRPDGVIADVWADSALSVSDCVNRIGRVLPQYK